MARCSALANDDDALGHSLQRGRHVTRKQAPGQKGKLFTQAGLSATIKGATGIEIAISFPAKPKPQDLSLRRIRCQTRIDVVSYNRPEQTLQA